ncbi:MAG: hypothetical protein ACFFGZ_09325 [Candidatus Thorarchaeota archaeon]
MPKFFLSSKLAIETNSQLWQKKEFEDDYCLQLTANVEEDHVGGKVALIGGVRRNYSMEADFKFLGHHLSQERAGWFGFVIRAKDLDNYELIWFMPNAEEDKTVAYLPVAHGVVPWWTEGYATQEKGNSQIPHDSWFRARVEVVDDEMTLYIEEKLVFTKKLTYYLTEGRPGLYVGTATDAAFRRITIKDLPSNP